MTSDEIKKAFDDLNKEREKYWTIIEKCHARLDAARVPNRRHDELYERLCDALDGKK